VSTRATAWLAWSVCALSLSMLAVVLIVAFLGWSSPLPRGWETRQDMAIETVGYVGAPLLGGLIASRQPHNPYGWLWLGFGLVSALAGLGHAYAVYALVLEPGSLPASRTVAALLQSYGFALLVLLWPFLLLLYPDGRLPSRRWRVLAWIVLAVGAVMLIVAGFLPESGFAAPVESPFALEGAVGEAIGLLFFGGMSVLFCAIIASALSLVFRFRRAVGVERQQLKWFAYAAVLLGGFVVLGSVLPNLSDPLDALLTTVTFLGLYAAIGVAILRYRLYAIDVIINWTLVYGSLTGTLALIYLGGVATTQDLFRALTSQEQQPQLAIVISTLVIAALFNPLRRRIQAFIDRLFYRRKYDAAKTLEAFGSRLRQETDLDALSSDVVGVARRTVQPAHVSLWLRPDPAPQSRRAALKQFGHDE
jgi:hypothetical protein